MFRSVYTDSAQERPYMKLGAAVLREDCSICQRHPCAQYVTAYAFVK